ncbi:hypothetical protein WJX77_002140 [Trebouxia sp. C0004]
MPSATVLDVRAQAGVADVVVSWATSILTVLDKISKTRVMQHMLKTGKKGLPNNTRSTSIRRYELSAESVPVRHGSTQQQAVTV